MSLPLFLCRCSLSLVIDDDDDVDDIIVIDKTSLLPASVARPPSWLSQNKLPTVHTAVQLSSLVRPAHKQLDT